MLGVVGFAITAALIPVSRRKRKKPTKASASQKAETSSPMNQEKTRAREAEQRLFLARRSADEMIALAQEEISDNSEIQNLRRRMLEASLAYYEEFIELRREDRTAQAELEATRDRVKNILADLVLSARGGPAVSSQAPGRDRRLEIDQGSETPVGDLVKKSEKNLQNLFGSYQRRAPTRGKKNSSRWCSNEATLAEIFEPEQLKRFRQIALQCEGPMVFREPEIANALKLTPIQKRRIRAIEAGIITENDGREVPIPPNTPSWKVREERRKSEMRQILQILTEEQVAQWRELTGEPFTEPIFLPPGPPHKGPPPKGPSPKGPMPRITRRV